MLRYAAGLAGLPGGERRGELLHCPPEGSLERRLALVPRELAQREERCSRISPSSEAPELPLALKTARQLQPQPSLHFGSRLSLRQIFVLQLCSHRYPGAQVRNSSAPWLWCAVRFHAL